MDSRISIVRAVIVATFLVAVAASLAQIVSH